jgi:8-oxo-dGTP pyrophosphatase MutT (NUDIX family)
LPKDASAIARWCAAALLVTPDGRYLMQLRDPKPTIVLPGHWGLFGGTIEAGETGEDAVRRELREELEYAAREVRAFTEMDVVLPYAKPRRDRISVYAVPIAADDVDRMVQHEGAGKRLFHPDDLAREARVAPWDLAAVLMHARAGTLFAG